MHDDGSGGRPLGTGARPRQRIRADLERRGVTDPFAEPFSERLAEIAAQLSTSEYHAAVLAMAAAFEVWREESVDFESRCRDAREIQRLMQGFAGEMRKLEECLAIVSAYLTRLRQAADGSSGGSVH